MTAEALVPTTQQFRPPGRSGQSVHPSAVLRAADARQQMYDGFVHDLALVRDASR